MDTVSSIVAPETSFEIRLGKYLRVQGYVLLNHEGDVITADDVSKGEFGLSLAHSHDAPLVLGIVRVQCVENHEVKYFISCEVLDQIHHNRLTELCQELSIQFSTMVTCRLRPVDSIVL